METRLKQAIGDRAWAKDLQVDAEERIRMSSVDLLALQEKIRY